MYNKDELTKEITPDIKREAWEVWSPCLATAWPLSLSTDWGSSSGQASTRANSPSPFQLSTLQLRLKVDGKEASLSFWSSKWKFKQWTRRQWQHTLVYDQTEEKEKTCKMYELIHHTFPAKSGAIVFDQLIRTHSCNAWCFSSSTAMVTDSKFISLHFKWRSLRNTLPCFVYRKNLFTSISNFLYSYLNLLFEFYSLQLHVHFWMAT